MKKILRVLLCTILAFVLAFVPVVHSSPFLLTTEAATVKLSKTSATMYEGTALKLKVTGTSKKITWSSSKKSVATVSSSGKVTAKNEGTATIKAKVGSSTYTCKIKVKEVPKLNLTKKTVYVGDKVQLKLDGYTIGTVKWTTSNKKVATVKDGKVTAKKSGTATIKATVGKKILSFKLTVKATPKLNVTEVRESIGEKVQLELSGYKIGTVKWTTSNKKIATVKDGLVTIKKAGTATIKAKVGSKIICCTVTGIDPDKPMVALTFDDGPSKYTPRILDVFKEHGGKGTFFVVGNRIADYTKITQRVVDEGHEIGGHSWDHSLLTSLSKSQMKKQIVKTSDKIYDVTGVETTLIRPTYGAYNSNLKKVCKEQGVAMINWTVDPEDWKYRDADVVYKHIMSNVSDGDIILCHDLYNSTAEAMERVVPELIEEGYQLVTVSELFAYKGMKLTPGKVYGQN